MIIPNPDKLLVLWQKGRNYFATFFTELALVRNEIGNDIDFAKWCDSQLQISVGVLGGVRNVLKEADAARVKEQLASARLAEQMRKAAEKAALAKARLAEREARAEEKARADAEKKQRKREQREAAYRERQKEAQQRHKERKRQEKLAAYAATAKNIFDSAVKDKNVVKLPDDELAQKIKIACSRLTATRIEWVDVSIELAALLCEGRARCGNNDRAFGEWLDRNGIAITYQDRAALINLGSDISAMRLAYEQSDSMSHRMIWQNVQRRISSTAAE